jgi:hypothetical protein
MTESLVVICCECEKIKIGDNTWIGKEHPLYELLSKRPGISDGYCPEHIDNNQLRRKIMEKIEYALFG